MIRPRLLGEYRTSDAALLGRGAAVLDRAGPVPRLVVRIGEALLVHGLAAQEPVAVFPGRMRGRPIVGHGPVAPDLPHAVLVDERSYRIVARDGTPLWERAAAGTGQTRSVMRAGSSRPARDRGSGWPSPAARRPAARLLFSATGEQLDRPAVPAGSGFVTAGRSDRGDTTDVRWHSAHGPDSTTLTTCADLPACEQAAAPVHTAPYLTGSSGGFLDGRTLLLVLEDDYDETGTEIFGGEHWWPSSHWLMVSGHPQGMIVYPDRHHTDDPAGAVPLGDGTWLTTTATRSTTGASTASRRPEPLYHGQGRRERGEWTERSRHALSSRCGTNDIPLIV